MKTQNKPALDKIARRKMNQPECNQEQLSQKDQQNLKSANEQSQQQDSFQQGSEQVQRQVYKVYAKRTKKGRQTQYKVQYVNDKTLQWEFLSNLGHAMDKIREYESHHDSDKKVFKTVQLKLENYGNKKGNEKTEQKQKIDQQKNEKRELKASVESQEKEVNKKQTKANKKSKVQDHDAMFNKLKQKLFQNKNDDPYRNKQDSKAKDQQVSIKTRSNRKQSEQAKESQNSSADQADLGSRKKQKQPKQVLKRSKPTKKIKPNQQYADKVQKKKRAVEKQNENAKQIDSDPIQNQKHNQKEEQSRSSKDGGLSGKTSRQENKQENYQKQSQSQKSKKMQIKESDHSNGMTDSKCARVSVLDNVVRQEEQLITKQNGKSHMSVKYKVLKVLGYSINRKEPHEKKEMKYKVQIEMPDKTKQEKQITKEQFQQKFLQKLGQFLTEELSRAKFVKRTN